MPTINILKNPAHIGDVKKHFIASDEIFLDWLIRHYGENGFPMHTEVFVGTLNDIGRLELNYESLNKPLTQDCYIVHRPHGPAIPYLVISLVVAVAVYALLPVPDIAAENQQLPKKSPNNDITGQTNIARTLERVPDIFGEAHSYPDLILPTIEEFENNIKFLTEYMCISRGYIDVDEVKSGDTLISNIDGADFALYEPNTQPSEILRTNTSNEVKGQNLSAPNELTVVIQEGFAILNSSEGTGGIVPTLPSEVDDLNIFSTGDLIDISNLIITSLPGNPSLDGAGYTISNIFSFAGATSIELDNPQIINSNWNLVDGIIGVFTTNATISKVNNGDIGPFPAPTSPSDEVWIDIQAPQGLAQGSSLNKPREVELEFDFTAISGPGASFTFPVSLNEKTRNPYNWTFKINPTTDPNFDVNTEYTVSGRRITNADLNTLEVLETITWTRLASVVNITQPDLTGTTRIVVKTQATDQVASLQQRQLNLRATRKCLTYNGVNVVGDLNTGVGLTASRRFADAFITYALDPALGGRNEAQLDLDAIYDIQNDLDAVFGGRKGEFSYTFDGKQSPAINELIQIAQAVRCFVIKEGSFITISRDQEQLAPVSLFNRRNKLPGESRSVRFNKPLDNDGVQLDYIDIDDNQARTITLPNDLPAGDPNLGLPSTVNPLKVEAVGIRQYDQAWDRAQYELNKLIYSRVSVESKVTPEGILVPLNSRIRHADGTRLTREFSEGEVIAIDGNNITTDQRCIFSAGTYSVNFRDDEGNLSAAVPVTPLPDSEFGFVLGGPSPFALYVRGTNNYQVGTLFYFANDSDNVEDMLIQRKTPDTDGNITLELINYAPEYYQADDQVPPPKA